MNIRLRKFLPEILTLSLFTLIYIFHISESFNFHADFARDASDIASIINGKFTLIGPRLSFGGLFAGPYYYYLFLPIAFLTKLNINGFLYFNATLFIFALWYLFKNIKKHFGSLDAVLATLVLGFLPLYIVASRGPWNGSTYLPFLMIFLTTLYFQSSERVSNIKLLLLGILGGILVNFHPVNLPVVIFAVVYFLIVLKQKHQILFFLLGAAITFSPWLLFEAKHNFVMTRATLSGNAFPRGSNIVSGIKLALSVLGLGTAFEFATLLLFWTKIKTNQGKIFLVSTIIILALSIVLMSFQSGNHYVFPAIITLLFTVIVLSLETKSYFLLAMILVFEVSSFPKYSYQNSPRTYFPYEQAVNYVIKNKVVTKGGSFNIIQLSKDYGGFVPEGDEYRFFFKKNQVEPDGPQDYDKSKTLLIFSEIPSFKPTQLNSWESNQFGEKFLGDYKTYTIGKIQLYKIVKN